MDPDAARFGDGRIEAAGQSRPLIDLVGPEGIDADGEIRPGATSTNSRSNPMARTLLKSASISIPARSG